MTYAIVWEENAVKFDECAWKTKGRETESCIFRPSHDCNEEKEEEKQKQKQKGTRRSTAIDLVDAEGADVY